MHADRLKNGTVAKVAMHAAQLYQQARDQAESIRSEADVASFAFADVSQHALPCVPSTASGC